MTMKRLTLIWVMILCLVFLYSSCAEIDSCLVCSWVADETSEYDLKLGHDSRYGDITKVIYRISRDGDLAIEFSYFASDKISCYDVGPIKVDGNRISLNGQGTFTVDGNVLTIHYDDGTVRTFSRK